MTKIKLFMLLIVVILLALIGGCATEYSNREPLGQSFPQSRGENLEQQSVKLPEDLAGKEVLLLLGYVQNSQFDIDRWLIGLDMTNTLVDVYELPTIQGMFPAFFETQINSGMRKGIPKELWKGVITIYDDGDKIQQFTGNTNPNNARVVLLDDKGQIIFFYDRGFSVAALNRLKIIINDKNKSRALNLDTIEEKKN